MELFTADFWAQVQSSVGTPILLALAMSVFLFFVLNRSLHREIEKRLRTEAETEEERNRLNAILNKAGVGVQLVDRNLRLIDVNYRWCEMFGHRRRDVRANMKAIETVHPNEAATMEAHFGDLLSGRVKTLTQERRFVRKNGSAFWGLVSTSTVEAKDGSLKWVVAMITDIDAQKKAEEALRESEERLRFITENTHDVVWQLDSEFRFTYVNSADERMRGFPREKVIGQHFRSLIPPARQAVFDQAMLGDGAEADGRTIHFEVEMTCQGGTLIWADINSTPIHDLSGKIIGYIGVTRDATQRREMQRELREQAIRDPLSGLFNRRFLAESLPRELARARRDNLPLSILMIDIDHFKKLNDTHGHPVGDEVICQLARLIHNGVRSGDLPCRYGGEEFLLVLPNMTIESAAERADQWREAFQEIAITVGEESISSTFSAGVVAFPLHGNTSETLIQAADKALYAAKNAGRNCIVVGTSNAAPTLPASRGQ